MKEKITEQDLFNYIFNPDKLTSIKKEVIDLDESYAPILKFYKEVQLNFITEPDALLKKKIAEKIPSYKPNIFTLYPIKDYKVKKVRLAADSKQLNPTLTTKTFLDKDKNYITKVLSYVDSTKIYVFSKDNEIINNFNLIIEPGRQIHYSDNNLNPIYINKKIISDSITLELL